jgi:hypothetical protein
MDACIPVCSPRVDEQIELNRQAYCNHQFDLARGEVLCNLHPRLIAFSHAMSPQITFSRGCLQTVGAASLLTYEYVEAENCFLRAYVWV